MPLDPKDIIINTTSYENIKERMQVLQSSFVEQMDEKLGEVIGEMLREVESSDLLSHTQLFDEEESHKYNNRKKSDKQGALTEKQFLARNSLLTNLFRIKHIRTIYHIFIAILIILFLNTVIYDLVDTGRPNFAVFQLIFWSFGKFPMVIIIWMSMFSSSIGVYLCFYFFATLRTRLHHSIVVIWDVGWFCTFIAYQCTFVYVPLHVALYCELPPASSLIILIEQVRLFMKNHAFVRSNIPRARQYKIDESEADAKFASSCPGFSYFLYFLFVPTLIYRDSYPRTNKIRWRNVVRSVMEVIGVIFYSCFIFERLLIPEFQKFGQSPLALKQLVLLVFGSTVPGILAMFAGFFCLLHSLLNVLAEVTCFADRMFYKDWWNSSSFNDFFRTWNVIVHDWLYTYIYKDFYENIIANRVVSKLLTFAISAVIHEYVLTFAFRYFYPLILLMFGGIGVTFSFIRMKDDIGNIFLWFSLCIGTGVFLSLSSMEWYARINCPPTYQDNSTLLNYVIPRSWTCLTLEH